MNRWKDWLVAGALFLASAQTGVAATGTASIDWSTFSYQVYGLGPTPNPLPGITFDSQSSSVWAREQGNPSGIGDGSGDWTTPLSVTQGVALGTGGIAPGDTLVAQFTAHPAVPEVTANSERQAYFTLTANSYVVFSVHASTAIDMNVPQGGAAYSWAFLTVEGQDMYGGPDLQRSSTDKLSWANGFGNAQSQEGLLIASFSNLTGGDLSGQLIAHATVNSYGGTIIFVPGIPEPQTYAMLLAGLALVGTMALRRKRDSA